VDIYEKLGAPDLERARQILAECEQGGAGAEP
jgi:hypothetical protein